MRLFIATKIDLPFYGIIKERISPFVRGKWTSPENLHITHLFIGEDEPKKYMIKIPIPKEKITLKGVDCFNDKILHLKANSKNIEQIHRFLINKYRIKTKRFLPHITLCRIKEILDRDSFLNSMKSLDGLEVKCDFNLFLYASTLTPKGPIYKRLHRY